MTHFRIELQYRNRRNNSRFLLRFQVLTTQKQLQKLIINSYTFLPPNIRLTSRAGDRAVTTGALPLSVELCVHIECSVKGGSRW